MAYRHNVNTHRKAKQARRLRNVALVMVGLVVLGAGFVSVDWLLNRISTSSTVVTNETTSSVQAASVSAYRSPYFQFQAPDEWVVSADQSTDDTYVYVRSNGTFIEQRLTVYVNRSEAERESDIKIGYALPIEAAVSGLFMNVGAITSHCDESWPDGLKRDPARITHEDISFVCSVGTTQFNVVFGEEGDDENIEIILSDGSEATLTIVYSNLTAYPSTDDLYLIAESFTTL